MNTVTRRKRSDLSHYIQQKVLAEPAVQGVAAIGSVAKGTAHEDSDIDAVVFLNPYDLYAVPAEFYWRPEDDTIHGIFSDVADFIQLDFLRLDLGVWSEPGYEWPESIRAELSEGWLAFDRHGEIQKLIEERTQYSEEIRRERLDDAIENLDWLLGEEAIENTWETLGAETAHYRLQTAFDCLVQGLFAYNRRWRTLRSRELADLMRLPWLPEKFNEHLLQAANALSTQNDGYLQRAAVIRRFFDQVMAQCQRDGLYGDNPPGEAFIRQHDEPGRDWNMDEWNQRHKERKLSI